MNSLSRKFAVAPMMDWTDRHCRTFHRCLSTHAFLYTEMVTTGAILHGPRARLLDFGQVEHPLALQLGGSDPADLAAVARIGAEWGYDEINLNCGCPSDRVQSGRFGACLMADPDLVADGFRAMWDAVEIPVTVKCRIGIDDQEPRDALWRFVETLMRAGCRTFIVHARKAWLQGLSPKENRDVPPLDYALVHQLKTDFPESEIVLNGGIASLDEALIHLDHLDGVMLGRTAYQSPGILCAVDRRLFGAAEERDPLVALAQYRGYMLAQLAQGVPLPPLVRPLLGLFHGQAGARAYRRTLSSAHLPGSGIEVLDAALAHLAHVDTKAA